MKTSHVPGEQRIAFLDNLRVIGMFMVVGTHALGRAHLDKPVEGTIEFLVQAIAVPIFFLVDGFLFASKQTDVRDFHYTSYLRKSCFRLLVPWIGFSLIYLCLRSIFEYAGYLPEKIVLGKGPLSLLVAIYFSMLAPQMYFLLSLFFVRSLAFLHRYLLTISLQAAILSFLVYTTIYRNTDVKAFFHPGADPVLLSLWGLQFYLLGIVLFRIHAVMSKGAIWISLGGFALVAGLKLGAVPMILSVQYAYLIAVYALTLALSERFAHGLEIAKYNMGIYLLHTPVILTIVSVGLATVLARTEILYFVVVTTLAFALSAMLTKVISRTPLKIILGEVPRGFTLPSYGSFARS